MIVLGLDPSFSAYGWAVHDNSAKNRKRLIASGHEQTLPSTVAVARFLHFQSLVTDLIIKYDPEVIGIESPAYDAGPFQTIHFGLMMFSMVPIFQMRKDCILFDPATLKYLAKEDPGIRKGVMNKLDMQRMVQLDLNTPNKLNDNEADAYLIAKYAARLMMLNNNKIKPESLTVSEKRVFIERKRTVKTVFGKKVKRVAHAFRENSRYFLFSKIPQGDVSLPKKSDINKELLDFLESCEN